MIILILKILFVITIAYFVIGLIIVVGFLIGFSRVDLSDDDEDDNKYI